MAESAVATPKRFFGAVRRDQVDKVRAALDAGFDLSTAYDPHRIDRPPTTALHHALESGADAVARLLLDRGADPNRRNGYGDYPLHLTSEAALVERLLAAGAEVNARDRRGRTALHRSCAAHRRDLAVIAALLRGGADVDAVDDDGLTAYHHAARVDARDLLRSHGATGLASGTGSAQLPTRTIAVLSDVDVERGCIGADRIGGVWFGGYSGLFRRLPDGRVDRFEFDDSFAIGSIVPGPPADSDDTVYVATNAGLLRFSDGQFRHFRVDNSELFDNHITGLFTGADGRVFFLCYETGLPERHIGIVDGESFAILRPGVDFPTGLELTCVSSTPDGSLLVGGENGFAWHDGAQWRHLTSFDDSVFDPSVQAIEVVGDDVWLGTQNGTYRLRDGAFTHVETDSVACLCWDGESLWGGASWGGLFRIHDAVVTRFREDDSALPDDNVHGLVRATDGTIWVHAGSEVAWLRDGEPHAVTHESEPDDATHDDTSDGDFAGTDRAGTDDTADGGRTATVAANETVGVGGDSIPADVRDAFTAADLTGITADELLRVVRPAIEFDLTGGRRPVELEVGASRFGGLPDLPDDVPWPTFSYDDEAYLPFIMQVNLADVAVLDLERLLPETGMLLFFSDTSPDDIGDARVLHVDAPVELLRRRDLPDDLSDRLDDDDFVARLPEWRLTFAQRFTLPSAEFLAARADLADSDKRALAELRRLLDQRGPTGDTTGSRLLGWPDNQQGEFLSSHKQIVLLQLCGEGLRAPRIDRVFRHWCGDGLIHTVLARKHLRKRRFDRATTEMTYT